MQAEEFRLHAEVEDEHWWFKARRNIILSLIKRFTPGRAHHLVEIGCGTGGNLRLLANFSDKVTGLDASQDAVNYARDRVQGEVLLGDFRTALKNKWPEFDVVLIADVLEHVEDDAGFLTDIIDAVMPGTLVMITVPAHKMLWSPHDVALGHFRRYSRAQLKTLWQGHAVEQLFFSPFNFVLSPVVFLLRLLSSNDESTSQSDLKKHSSLVNTLLYFLFNLESKWLPSFGLPWGCSYAAVLKKK